MAPPPTLDPAALAPVLEGETPAVALPPPPVVRPPAAWVGLGLPQPGSMFENLSGDRSLDGLGKFVALTFDDGPSQYTQQIFDILRFMGVKATFFQITDQTGKRLDLVRQMVADGMHIGAHTRGHPHLRELPPEAQADQVQGSIDVLNMGFGAGTVKCFRPPYGEYDQRVLDLVAQRQVATAMWSFDTWDWKKPAWPTIVNRVLNGVRDRQVILMHDGGGDRTQTIAALPWIIQGLRDRGFQFIPVC